MNALIFIEEVIFFNLNGSVTEPITSKSVGCNGAVFASVKENYIFGLS